jgi:hypothetical protein
LVLLEDKYQSIKKIRSVYNFELFALETIDLKLDVVKKFKTISELIYSYIEAKFKKLLMKLFNEILQIKEKIENDFKGILFLF